MFWVWVFGGEVVVECVVICGAVTGCFLVAKTCHFFELYFFWCPVLGMGIRMEPALWRSIRERLGNLTVQHEIGRRVIGVFRCRRGWILWRVERGRLNLYVPPFAKMREGWGTRAIELVQRISALRVGHPATNQDAAWARNGVVEKRISPLRRSHNA